MAWVYSSANWAPFTGDQNLILNWVLKLNPLKQKVKKLWKLDRLLWESLINCFLLLGVIDGVKSPYKRKKRPKKGQD